MALSAVEVRNKGLAKEFKIAIQEKDLGITAPSKKFVFKVISFKIMCYLDLFKLGIMLVIYGTLKNCNKKIRSPCLFSPCEPVILVVFSLLALEILETLTTIKNSYFIAKNMNLTKTLRPFVFLGYIFPVKCPKITRS